jgi:hypothetical protein
MYVSKLDAARRQLEASVRLFFANGDPVAMTTLAGAACNVLRDLATHESKGRGLEQVFEDQIRPERLGEVRQMLRKAPNFFKHADHDPGEVIEFNPTFVEVLLWDGITMYRGLTGEGVPLLETFYLWWALTNPHLLAEPVRRRVEEQGREFSTANRRAFRDEFLPIAEQLYSGAG